MEFWLWYSPPITKHGMGEEETSFCSPGSDICVWRNKCYLLLRFCTPTTHLLLKLLCDILGQRTTGQPAPLSSTPWLRWPLMDIIPLPCDHRVCVLWVRIPEVYSITAASHSSPCQQRKGQGSWGPLIKPRSEWFFWKRQRSKNTWVGSRRTMTSLKPCICRLVFHSHQHQLDLFMTSLGKGSLTSDLTQLWALRLSLFLIMMTR